VSNTASNIVTSGARPTRRSSRLDQAIPVTVMGIDSWRGPYREQVSTITISAHGCKYESKYQVMNDSLVILELSNGNSTEPPVSTRARVKWAKRLPTGGDLFQTAIELEEPGNVWGLPAPPKDWLPFCGSKDGDAAAKLKLVPAPKPAPSDSASVSGSNGGAKASAAAPALAEKYAKGKPAQEQKHEQKQQAPVAAPSMSKPMGLLMGEFQQQMERMLSEAATAAVRERATELRTELRDDTRKYLAEVIKAQAGPWVEKSLAQLNRAIEESSRSIHAHWNKRIEADLRAAAEQVETRNRELEQRAETLSTSAAERLQRVMETTRREEVDRFVARLKEQLAPLLDSAQKIATQLLQQKNETEKVAQQTQKAVQESLEQSAARVEETASRLEERFEKAIEARFTAAQEELGRAGKAASEAALNSLRESSESYALHAQTDLRTQLEPVAAHFASGLEEKAVAVQKQFAEEIEEYSRSHFEYVGGAFAELARGLGKLKKD
jgi:hypothetical protein